MTNKLVWKVARLAGLFNSPCRMSDTLPARQFWTFINWTNSGQLSVANLVDHSLREGICKVVQLAVKSVGLWVHVSREERASGGVSSIISTALPLHSWQTGGTAQTGNATPSSQTVSCEDAHHFFLHASHILLLFSHCLIGRVMSHFPFVRIREDWRYDTILADRKWAYLWKESSCLLRDGSAWFPSRTWDF